MRIDTDNEFWSVCFNERQLKENQYVSTACKRSIDFICPFVDGEFHCPEFMSPTRPTPSHREKKLFVLMGKTAAPTKNACPHCSLFIKEWRNQIGLLGHIKYAWIWLKTKEIRRPNPQEQL
jgi:hypothetical protein